MRISVVIPTFNEEKNIIQLVGAIKKFGEEIVNEVIIVDGGRTDHTLGVVNATGIKIHTSPKKGRASQMNYGAHHATGEILFFVHADVRVPDGFAWATLQGVTDFSLILPGKY